MGFLHRHRIEAVRSDRTVTWTADLDPDGMYHAAETVTTETGDTKVGARAVIDPDDILRVVDGIQQELESKGYQVTLEQHH